jgi:uncharacterized membrane protein YbhN (UPF0104 family)
MNDFFKKNIIFIGKFIVSVGLLVFIFTKIDTGIVLKRLQSADLFYILAAIILINFVILLSSMRWRELVNISLDNPLKQWESYQINLVAAFFNLISPGRIFGDAYRAYYIYGLNNNRSISINPLILDRIFILGVTVIFSCVLIFWMNEALVDTFLPIVLLSILSLGFVVMSILIWLKPFKNLNFLNEFYNYLVILIASKKTIFYCVFLSILMILSLVGFFWSLILSLGLIIEVKEIFIILVLTILISSIPITLSGLGLREGVLIILLGYEGISPSDAVAISLLWYGLFTFASLPGLIVFFNRRAI